MFLVGCFGFLYSDKAVIPTIKIRTGAKPVSVFGLAHRICDTTVGTNLHRDFPRLKEETFPTDANSKGVSAFIKDYIVDFGMLERINVHGGTDTPGWVQDDIV